MALLDAARGSFSQPNARQFALTWLAAARMAVLGRLQDLKGLSDLNTEAGWRIVEAAGLPVDAVSHLFGGTETGEVIGLRARAVAIVTELYAELEQQPWDVLPSVTAFSFRAGRGLDGAQEISAGVAELLLDLAGEPNEWLWLPFDSNGTMTIRALRRGWRVKAASMTEVSHSTLKLLLAIEYGSPTHPDVDTQVERDSSGRPSTTAPYVVAVPTFGEIVRHGRLAQWDSTEGRAMEHYARSDAWAIHELMRRATKRAIFLVPPGVLFTRGQEQRLREFLLQRGGERNEIEAVIALPPGVLSSTNMSSAILVANPGGGTDAIRMVDLGISKRSLADLDETVQAGRLVALGIEQDEERARLVSRDEVITNEYTLTPSRYVRRQVEVGPNAVRLEELCVAIRPPALTKDEDGVDMVEVGIPEIGSWRRIAGPFSKQVKLKTRGRNLPTLQRDDLVLSVKGTVGKAGLLGAVEENTAVVSQSCLALRVQPGKDGATVLPEYLLMYLRSDAGRFQLEGLQVGATMQHVSPATLLNSFQVPLPSLEEQRVVVSDYEQLCALEAQIAELEGRMKDIAQQRWAI